MARAVDTTFLAYIAVYLTVGISTVLQWGGDIPSPIPFTNTGGAPQTLSSNSSGSRDVSDVVYRMWCIGCGVSDVV